MASQRQERAAFSFLVCPDAWFVRRRLAGELAGMPKGHERQVYWGDEEPPPPFWAALSLQGLFCTEKAVIVRQAQLWGKDVWQRVSHVLASIGGQARPFFCLEAPFEKGRPKLPAFFARLACFAHAEKKGWVWREPGLTVAGIGRHVQQRARELGLDFEPRALSHFCGIMPPDALAIESELRKFRLLGPRVDMQTLSASAYAPAGDIFACVRAIENGDLAACWREAARENDADRILFQLSALLARSFRALWEECAGGAGSFHPREAEHKRRLARRLGTAGISRAFAALAEAEWQVKSGRLQTEQALDAMLVELCGICGGNAAPRRNR